MRVGVIGLKGGSGCTLLTCELAYSLAKESQKQVILVDHAYTGSNMHIMLGKKTLSGDPLVIRGKNTMPLAPCWIM